jgi:hypothetical protein
MKVNWIPVQLDKTIPEILKNFNYYWIYIEPGNIVKLDFWDCDFRTFVELKDITHIASVEFPEPPLENQYVQLNTLRDNCIGVSGEGKHKISTLKISKTTGITEQCHFCGEFHTHGVKYNEVGMFLHREPHCNTNMKSILFKNLKGEIFDIEDGYYLEIIE